MSEIIKKVTFDYEKKDGEKSSRVLYAPKFLKESFNSFKEIEKEQVNYISGYEIKKDDMSEEDIKEYEESLIDYFTLAVPTLQEYLLDLGLDPKKIQQKSFKKESASNINVIKD